MSFFCLVLAYFKAPFSLSPLWGFCLFIQGLKTDVTMGNIICNILVFLSLDNFQAWGVLEQRAGNLSAARRLFRSSLSINSQSYVTWMTWAALEEEQRNAVRAEEIRNLYFQQVSSERILLLNNANILLI